MEEVQESIIKPNVEQFSQKDLSEEAVRAAKQFGQKFQESSSYGLQALNSFTKGLQQQLQETQDGPATSSQYTKLFDGADATSTTHTQAPAQNKTSEKKISGEDEWEEF